MIRVQRDDDAPWGFGTYRALGWFTRSREDAENSMRELEDITGAIVDTALRMHRDLGPGLLESVYERILARGLEQRGFRVERQRSYGSNTTAWCSKKDFAWISSWMIESL